MVVRRVEGRGLWVSAVAVEGECEDEDDAFDGTEEASTAPVTGAAALSGAIVETDVSSSG